MVVIILTYSNNDFDKINEAKVTIIKINRSTNHNDYYGVYKNISVKYHYL